MLNNTLLNTLKSIAVIPTGLMLMLISISFTIGWNIGSLFLFWFILVPVLATRLPKNKNSIIEPLSGLILFYGLMVLMIYKQYHTDYFKVMIISGLINILIVSLISFVKRTVAGEAIAASA